ncbi:Orm1 type endoplasmic reticulum protein [Artomyces pyxidatus]|uniref:Orm1 type endoplasmic reticulum protein n=1 Tax=Artomyces pyxidatus TaxID=48021 RepID=A0ACB8TBH9_9AGAM|nr:Orm1 type endoplasmic reticulum protein [Artomyces pyxidatus]
MSGLNPPNIKLPGLSIHTSGSGSASHASRRGRSGSLLKVEKVDSSTEEVLDQSAYANLNAEWVNRKGAWMIHVVLIATGKVVIDTLPGMTQNVSWTTLSYLMFHWVTGIPFQNELHGGAYDDLTLWEQIDEGAQNTPSKKWLFSVPVGLFLLSTHYTNYDPWLFAINLSALIFTLIPKLPMAHRQRLHFLPDQSGVATPITSSFPPSGASTPPEGFRSQPVITVTEAQFR